MKSKFMITMVVALALFSSCELVPDLNPNTNAGADITVYEIGDDINESTVEYDLDQDGINEIVFKSNWWIIGITWELSTSGGILVESTNTNLPYYTPLTLTNTNSQIQFASYAEKARLGGPISIIPFVPNIPFGNRYLMIKIKRNGKLHYGWIDYTYTPINNTYQFIINRVGIANQPGQVLRAGQTD